MNIDLGKRHALHFQRSERRRHGKRDLRPFSKNGRINSTASLRVCRSFRIINYLQRFTINNTCLGRLRLPVLRAESFHVASVVSGFVAGEINWSKSSALKRNLKSFLLKPGGVPCAQPPQCIAYEYGVWSIVERQESKLLATGLTASSNTKVEECRDNSMGELGSR